MRFSKPSIGKSSSRDGGEQKKIVLIESTNPRWEDLAEKCGAEMAFAGQSIAAR
jgi:hypothetical protein